MKISLSTAWAPMLKDNRAIADYISQQSSQDVDEEQIEELFFNCRAVLKQVPITSLHEGDENGNVRSAAKEKRYAKKSLTTMPPLVVEDGKIQDGNHRFRVAKSQGATHIWIYDVEEE